LSSRRVVAVVLALVSSSIACGGFLGFGDDDELPAPSIDAGPEVSAIVDAAEGSTTTVDATPAEVCETRTLVLGTDAGIAGPDWSKGVTTTTGGATLSVEEGRLVSRSGDGDAGGRPEATLFATRSGNASRVRCRLRVGSSSFAGNGRLLELRVEGPKWVQYYGVRIDWANGVFRTVYQAEDTAGASFSAFPPFPAPAVNTLHDLTAELVLGDVPKFTMTLDGMKQEMSPPPPDAITRTQVVIGTVVLEQPLVPHEVRYESVSCEMCITP
jgi:hypothetical protein